MKPGIIRASLLCAALILGCGTAHAQQASETPQHPADRQTTAAIDPKAMAVVAAMAEHLAKAPRFGVTINASYDVVQDNGQKIQFGERRTLLLDRPDNLRTDVLDSDGGHREVVFDGKAISMLNVDHKVYGRVEKAGSVDDAVRYVIQDLGIRLPLALMLVTTLPDELQGRVRTLAYVERDVLTPTPTDHLAGRTDAVDFEIWITTGGKPVPQRVTITYREFEGAPQYRADFSNWNMDPDVSAAKLAFRAPKGAEQIPVLVRLPDAANDTAGTGAQQPAASTGANPK
jgi:hypothetical protein